MADDPPLLIYQQTRDHLLLDPRPGPRHALRASPRPDLRRLYMDHQDAAQDDLTGTDRLVENTEKGDDGADLELEQPPQDPGWIPASVIDENGVGR